MQSHLEVVNSFLEAWGSGDTERVMRLFATDASFLPSAASNPSHVYVGHAAIRPIVTAMLQASASSQFSVTGTWGTGADYFATWVVTPKDSASDMRVFGIDHFVVRDGFIAVKDAYRKVVS